MNSHKFIYRLKPFFYKNSNNLKNIEKYFIK